MRILLAILLSVIFTISVYGEILADPEFKKPESNWHLRKGKEYRQIQETYKKGEFTMTSPAPSSRTYLCLLTPADLEEGEVYKVQMEVKTSGSGVITYGYGTFGKIFAEKVKKQKGKKDFIDLKSICCAKFLNINPMPRCFTSAYSLNHQVADRDYIQYQLGKKMTKI